MHGTRWNHALTPTPEMERLADTIDALADCDGALAERLRKELADAVTDEFDRLTRARG